MNSFFAEMKPVSSSLDVLDQAYRIYNIDESWTGSKDDQWRSKVISREDCSLYVAGDTERPHNFHYCMCICANGSFLPMMLTFAKSVPRAN